MSSGLQLDVRHLSLGRRHLANAYEIKAGIGVIAGKKIVLHACMSALSVRYFGATNRALYKYTRLHCKRKILKVSNKKYSMHGAYIE